jgi:hypothetical protein
MPSLIPQPSPGSSLGGNPERGDAFAGMLNTEPVKQELKPDLVERFSALIDEVADELMLDGGNSREVCRADAITLLLEAVEKKAVPNVESPLKYMLMEEQQKAAAALGKTSPMGHAHSFLKLC